MKDSLKIRNDKNFWLNKFKYDEFHVMINNLNIKEYHKTNNAMKLSRKLIDLSESRFFDNKSFIITEINYDEIPYEFSNKISVPNDLLKFKELSTQANLEVNILISCDKEVRVLYIITGFDDKFMFVEGSLLVTIDINFLIFTIFYYYNDIKFWDGKSIPYDL